MEEVRATSVQLNCIRSDAFAQLIKKGNSPATSAMRSAELQAWPKKEKPRAVSRKCLGHAIIASCDATWMNLSNAGCSKGRGARQADVSAYMTGVVEVQLPMDYKIRNIEETEAAKKQMLGAARKPHSGCILCPLAVT